MSDFKSKLPDFKEITSIATKLFKDLRSSLDEIVKDYKHKRTTESHKAPTKHETHEHKAHKTHQKEDKPKAEHREHHKTETKKSKKSDHGHDKSGH